jgi:hypothetical protein
VKRLSTKPPRFVRVHIVLFLNLTKGYADALTQSIGAPVPTAMCLLPISYVRFPSRSLVF